MELGKKLDDLDLSNDEVKRLTEAMKNEEFRKLLVEYAEEISDPENRKRYEAEIAQLENEKGMDVKFVNPEPGHVIKSTSNGSLKTFINICKNENIDKPKCTKKIGPNGKPGHQWSIPHSFAPVREDTDKTGGKCQVIDFVVHPETYRMSEGNVQFKKMLHDTAFDGIERTFDMKMDRKNIKFPKMTFKGTPAATVIRTKKDDVTQSQLDANDPLHNVSYPYSNKSSKELTEEQRKKVAADRLKREAKSNDSETMKTEHLDNEFEKPKYNIIHRGYFDIQDFREAPDAKATTRPKELVVEVELPLLKSASAVVLDVLERKISLTSTTPAKYKLDLDLAYPVDEENGGAKFDKSKRKLIITLPVLPAKIPTVSFINDESKVDSNDQPENTLDMNPNCSVSDVKPLIEVLTSNENVNREGIEMAESGDLDNGCDTKMTESESAIEEHFPQQGKQPKVFYSFPQFDYLQDDETVTLIFDIKNGVRESLEKNFIVIDSKCKGVELTIISMGSGGFPMNYRCVVKFQEECIVEDASSYIDVGPHNVVVTFIKNDACLGHWEKLYVGQSQNTLEERLFLSEKSLQDELERLDSELASRTRVNPRDMPDLEVADMNSDQLTVHIKEPSRRLRRSVSESGEDIEVVHEKEVPRIPGILKKRSVSESSDDLCSPCYNRQCSSSSPISESDENAETTSSDERERKKSVSFNEHVQSATFKGNASVASMRQVLKSKRRKARKQEKSRQGRRRRNSNSVSEPSSDEPNTPETDHNTPQLHAATHEREAENPEGNAGDNVSKSEQDKTKPESVKQNLEDTIRRNEQTNNANKQQHEKGDTNENVQGHSDITADKVHTKSDDVTENGDVHTEDSDERTKTNYDSDDYDEKEKITAAETEAANQSQAPPPAKDPDAPETMLSWSERPADPALMPHCAVPLSNSVMFDLDVD